MSIHTPTIAILLSLLITLQATAAPVWPESLPVVRVDGHRYDCLLYPFHEVDATPERNETCSKGLAKTFHPYLDRKYEYLLGADGSLCLTKMSRKDTEGRFVDVTNCYLDAKTPLPLTYTGVVIIPLERKRDGKYRIIWLENGKVKYDNTYDPKAFEEKVKDNEKRLDANEMTIRMMMEEYFGEK